MDAEVVGVTDLFHMMSYDQRGQHSTWQFGVDSVKRGIDRLPPRKLTMVHYCCQLLLLCSDWSVKGLPFYARHVRTGDWKTYEVLDLCVGVSASGGSHSWQCLFCIWCYVFEIHVCLSVWTCAVLFVDSWIFAAMWW